MTVFEGKEFRSIYDSDSGKTFSDFEFRNCRFVSCAISITKNSKLRATVRKVRLENCEFIGSALECAIVEDVIIDGFKAPDLFQTWGAVFKHVVLQGKIDRIMVSPDIHPGVATEEEQRAFDKANAEYYSKVDWALDISRGEFKELDIRSVPSRLIKRDPETQVVITRENAMKGVWRELDLSKTYWPTALEFFLKSGDANVVLVAPKRHKKFKDFLAGLQLLRRAGVAEPE